MNDTRDDQTDWTELQREHDIYQHEYTGPLVSQLRPTTDIQQEFAEADAAFAKKTTNLSITHNAFRKVRGDGNCGPRALFFAYFESLAKHADKSKLQSELDRLRSYDSKMEALVYIDNYAQDLVGPLIDDLVTDLQLSPDARVAHVLDAFNDSTRGSELTSLARTLTAVHVQDNAEFYAGFLDAMSAEAFSVDVTKVDTEFDQTAITALSDILLKPAAMTLQVLNLHRDTTSDHVDSVLYYHEENQQPFDIIRLLYRPGHYDLIYAPDTKVLNMIGQIMFCEPFQQHPLWEATYQVDASLLRGSPPNVYSPFSWTTGLAMMPVQEEATSGSGGGDIPSMKTPSSSRASSFCDFQQFAADTALLRSDLHMDTSASLPSDMPSGLQRMMALTSKHTATTWHTDNNQGHSRHSAFEPIALQIEDWQYLSGHPDVKLKIPLDPNSDRYRLAKLQSSSVQNASCKEELVWRQG